MYKRLMGTVALVGMLLAGCGGGAEDTTPNNADTEPATSVVEESPPADSVETASESTTTAPPAARPAEDAGKVTGAGDTYELAGGDFLLCETVNPAFAGDFNIQTSLGDTDFSLMGNVGDHSADHQGLRLGFPPDDERATDLELELEGRNLSGHGQTTDGRIEFSFDC